MAKGDVDDPEEDPALFPERRVRPWVVDDDAERKMEELRDDLERTLTSISPVKEGMGESILDRTLRSDNSGELFFKELASLEAKDRAKVAGVTSGCVSLYPIGEIFEDLYRETHGLPPRNQNHAYVQHEGDEGNCRPEEIHGAPEVESSAPPAAAVRKGGGRGSRGHDGGGGEGCCELATDPDVVRLLAELQAGLVDDPNCCSDGSDAELGGEGKGRAEEDEDDDDNDDKKKETDEGDRDTDQEGQEAAGDETKDGTNGPRLASEEQHPAGGESAEAAAGKERASSPRGGEHHNPEVVRRVDISRMKIDGGGPQARPRSAPSACLSAGGFSRLSSRASSSSRLARAVSQRLMEATREVEGQRAPEAQGGGGDCDRGAGRGEATGRLRPSTSASRIAQADERIDVVKQNAEALQASMSVKRTRYLNSRKPRAARWSPRDRDLPLGPRGQPSAPRAASHSAAPPPAAVRQRPKTAVAKNRRPRPHNNRGHAGNTNNGNPLLNHRETEFLFGAGTAPEVVAAAVAATAAEDDGDDVSRRAPSLRKTTLGRMLRRSSASSFSPSNGGDVRRRNVRPELSECGSSSASSLYRRPLSAGNACSGSLFLEDGKRRAGRGTAQAIDDDTSCAKHTLGGMPRAGKHAAVAQAAATRAKRRPSSAAPGNGCSRRRDRPPSPSQTSSHHYGRHQQTAGGGRTRTRKDSPSSRKSDGGGGQSPAARSSLARTRGDRHEAATAAQGCGYHGVGAAPAAGGSAEREPAAMMNARQALEATIREAVDTVSPVEQFVNARKTIADMKQINTKDSTGDILLSTQGMTKARIADDCWSSEAQRQYRG
ncbi:hypothetical protein Esi_0264_0020 [Ectocarpus siliculosus]|uniref:Uncharacterized protein n=1 Tax=Ectocarpus siliculosus TaxID=2880 RepID=D8LJR8_ECTSI|nr:hypothetical protein Esi_0264_0020 [Ectocarpus siliculosus]|eukprot:CBN75988.1 hypothetical protein Esi_0264_0020 [Ectocarpus siliculosus]